LLQRKDTVEAAMQSIAGRTVLVVDDEESLREMLCDFLSEHGALPHPASGGSEALTLAEDTAFDLVLLDVMMPGLSGIDTLERLEARLPGQPVLMLTAVADVETAVRAMQLGALDYVVKPVTVDTLLSKVVGALDRAKPVLATRENEARLQEQVLERDRRLQQRDREIQALNRLFQQALRETDAASA
jgi:DNA-binding response OmpR family regulator